MNSLYRTILLTILCGCMVSDSQAQDGIYGRTDTAKKATPPPAARVRLKPKGPKPIKNEISFGYRLLTTGWAGYMDLGKVKSRNTKLSDMFHNVNFWQLEFGEKKSPRQEKHVADENSSGNSGSYVYGKINNFYGLKIGYGIRTMLAGKPDPGSVSIHWSNVISASLGMLKPYYLNTISDPNAIKYSDATKSQFLNQQLIIGGAGFGTGVGEMKMIPGGNFKSMLHFDFSANRKSVVGIETGINIEYYAEPVPIMANQDAVPYFVDLFLAFQFGKRW
jgi:hypothetical protein